MVDWADGAGAALAWCTTGTPAAGLFAAAGGLDLCSTRKQPEEQDPPVRPLLGGGLVVATLRWRGRGED
jgi:hypothetical protein